MTRPTAIFIGCQPPESVLADLTITVLVVKAANGKTLYAVAKALFLVYLAEHGVIKRAASEVGVAVRTPFRWMNADPAFRQAVAETRRGVRK